MTASNPRNELPEGIKLDCYEVIQMIGSGGFSLIYLAEDEDTREQVVIKEYIPRKLARRDPHSLRIHPLREDLIDNLNYGRKRFFQEAKALVSLSHPNIVCVRNFFLAYNTGYMVMDYEPGKNLANYVKKHQGGLSLAFIMTVFPPILDALNLIHSRSLLHLDIKPNNIHLRPGGNPLLLDFGAVHQFATTRRTQAAHIVTPGYSPVEQYRNAGYVGPWSDVYAIGASIRACIEGKTPPSAVERHVKDELKPAVEMFKQNYPAYLLEAIDWAMEVDPILRPQNAGELLNALQNKTGRPKVNVAQSPDSGKG